MANDNVDGEASGIASPFAVGQDGGIRLAKGDSLITQYVETYVSDWENDNPFNQDDGITAAPIFSIADDDAWKARARKRVKRGFELYLQRSNLAELKDLYFSQDEEGAVNLNVLFRSIESDEELAISRPLSEGE